MSVDIEKTLQQLQQQLELQEKKLDTLLSIFGQISQVIEFKTVDKEMIISLIEDSAVQAKVAAEKTKEYQEKKNRVKNTPRGVKNHQEYKHLKWTGKSFADGLDYFKLIDKLDYDTWKKVADYFIKVDKGDEIADAQSGYILGYVTTTPEAVESKLEEIL